jgi:hypothetical protein
VHAIRVDRKYLVSAEVVQQLLFSTETQLTAEMINGQLTQRYQTEYWDTPELQLFHDGRGRRGQRRKIRVRRYGDAGAQFVEVKSRNARGMTVKAREAWTGQIFDAIPFLRTALGEQENLVEHVAPTAQTSYERNAYSLPFGGRLTVDRHLLVGTPAATTHSLFDSHSELYIVETKSPTHAPTAIDLQLWNLNLRPIALSKYALAILSFRLDLPANRWSSAARHLHPIDSRASVR